MSSQHKPEAVKNALAVAATRAMVSLKAPDESRITGEEAVQIARRLVDDFISVELDDTDAGTKEDSADVVYRYITFEQAMSGEVREVDMLHGWRSGAKSRKLRNIRVNMRRVISAASGGVLTVASVAGEPWTAPFAALAIIGSVFSELTVEIKERDAAVICTLWRLRDEEGFVQRDRVLDAVNAELTAYDRPAMNQRELDESLANLDKLSCIAVPADSPAVIKCIEEVKVKT